MSTATIPEIPKTTKDDELLHVPLASIRPPTANVREDFGELDTLAETIRKTDGLLQTLLVCRTEEGGYELIAGERRYRAAQLAGCATVPVVVRPRPDALERIELQLIENGERLDLSTPELFRAAQLMFDLGATDDRVGTTIGGSADDVATLRAIVSLGPAVHELIANGDLTVSDAAPLAELAGLDEQYVDHAVACIHQGHRPSAATNQALAKHRRDKVVAEATALAKKRKLTLIDPPKYGAYSFDGDTRRLGHGINCVDIPVKEHSKKPCHAAFINEHGSSASDAIVLVCTKASSHKRPAPPGLDYPRVEVVHVGAMSPAQKAAKTRQHRKDWSATHVSRNAAVSAMVGDLPLDEAMARVAWFVLDEADINQDCFVTAARMLGVSDLAPQTDPAKVVRDIAKEGGERAVRACVALLTAWAERDFQEKEGLGYRGDVAARRRNVRAHFELLQRHGYTLRDAEINHLDGYCGLRGFTPTGDGRLIDLLDDDDDEPDVDSIDTSPGDADVTASALSGAA